MASLGSGLLVVRSRALTDFSDWTAHRYLSSMLFQSIREECAQMDINERVMLTDEAGRQFYAP